MCEGGFMRKIEVKQIINNTLIRNMTKKEYTNIELAVGLNRLDYDRASLVFAMSEITGISDRQARKYISVAALDCVGFAEMIKERIMNLNTAAALLNHIGDNEWVQQQVKSVWLKYDGESDVFIEAIRNFDFTKNNDLEEFIKNYSKEYQINKKIEMIDKNIKEIRNQGSKEQQEKLSKILKKYTNE